MAKPVQIYFPKQGRDVIPSQEAINAQIFESLPLYLAFSIHFDNSSPYIWRLEELLSPRLTPTSPPHQSMRPGDLSCRMSKTESLNE